MATVAFVPYHIAGDLASGFAVGRALRARGHDVHFVGILDHEAAVRAQGFGFRPLFAKVLPKGKIREENVAQARGERLRLKELEARDTALHDALLAGELGDAVAPLRPDLLVVSTASPDVALAATPLEVPVALFSSCLSSPWDPIVPLITFGGIPRDSWAFRAKNRLAWRGLLAAKQVARLFWDEEKALRALATRFGFPQDRLDFRTETNWPTIDLPELVCWPSTFDFPRSRVAPSCSFVEPGVDLERAEGAFPWERLDPAKPLVYCAPGSMACYMHPPKAQRFLYAFFDAMARRPGWQGVAAISGYGTIDAARAPANVVVVDEAPQLALLRRAALFITHAGANSVKEGAVLGVPMIAIPLFFDQPGYAARIVHHGVGRRLKVKELDGELLARTIDAVDGDAGIKARARALGASLRAMQAAPPSVPLLEGMMGKAS